MAKAAATGKQTSVAPPRAVIENVRPQVDGGRFPIKRTVGERVVVTASIFADGHDAIAAVVRYRPASARSWQETPMELVNWGLDEWRGEFIIETREDYIYTVQAWMDRFASWRRDLQKKADANQDVAVDLLVGAELIEAAAKRARNKEDRRALQEAAQFIRLKNEAEQAAAVTRALDAALATLMQRHDDRARAADYPGLLRVAVDRERARFSAWYEMFPRSASDCPGRHGTFQDLERRLDYVAGMGFDVLYLPPIHPIGRTNRKGKNNSPQCRPDDTGSPWAIGAAEGGHKAIHPELGTLEDFRRLVARAKEKGLEVALDIAFQCAPDHPYVKQHPEWFRWRPDGSLQYAENPPKKYQDIYPFDFETDHWQELWEELKSVFEFWIEQGVEIFRVDNPHTKPLAFWEWLIADLRSKYPEVIFLSEAFTRPPVMYRLAKLGFTQSYTYFAWRNTKEELTGYLTELTRTEVCEYFRPNLWPNTPDILTEYLQAGGRPAFITRFVLAATLGASYGIYGPAFELCENRPLVQGREEYLDSEKYQLRHWEIDRPDSLRDIIARVNRIRREHPALQTNHNLRFHATDNPELIAYSKSTDDNTDTILVVCTLDPHYKQAGWTALDLAALGVSAEQPFQVHDLLTDERFIWHGARNYVELDPHILPAHIFEVRRRIRNERDFDYFA